VLGVTPLIIIDPFVDVQLEGLFDVAVTTAFAVTLTMTNALELSHPPAVVWLT
jgi:hypothetical protein